jgi:2-hydroxy-6-oxonona-2,4-dienedioate hydrolase
MSRTISVATKVESRADRNRRIEAELWAHHGLTPTERFVQLEEPAIRLRILEVGTGSPVLLIHGTVGPGGWASLIGALPGRRYIVVERPGWGGSEPFDYSNRPHRTVAADMLRGVLDALRIDRAAVIGGSIGDVWALSLAERYPSRVERVALLGGGPILAAIPRPSFIRLLASPLGALIVRLPVNADRARSILRDSGHGPSIDAGRIPVEFIDWRVSVSNDTKAMRHERQMVRSVVEGAGWKRGLVFDDAALRAIAAPTVLVHGTADPLGSVEVWRRMVDAMPDGRLEVIEGAGHMPWFDDPRRVADLVDGFLGA